MLAAPAKPCDCPAKSDPSIASILGLCARAQGDALQYCRLVKEADLFERWSALPGQAEFHGLGPLAYVHLTEASALMPVEARRALQGLTLRHRQSNEIRGRALVEIIQALEAQGIEALALKGSALAYMVYPAPGLRPMRDLDILVKEEHARRAQQILGTLGFKELPGRLTKEHQHLEPLSRVEQGLTVSVEVHTSLFPRVRYYRPLRFADLSGASLTFQVNGMPVRTLGLEDSLWHIYRHALGPPLLASPLRLIWVADLVSLVEKYVDQLDWSKVKRQYPQVWRILPLLDFITPWSANVTGKLELKLPPEVKGAGLDYQGWPRVSLKAGDKQELGTIMANTLNPPEWWLRLFYGGGTSGAWLWHRWLRHPWHVLEWMAHYAKEALTGRRYSGDEAPARRS
jgi:hypothetical protein